MRKILLAAAGFAALAAAPALAAAQEGHPRAHGFGLFQFDANSDGVVTRQEFDAGRAALFSRLDADNDGYLTREEMRAHMAERRSQRAAQGDITREQFLARPNAMFDRLDRNNDGVLSADERPQHRAQGERRQRGERRNIDTDGDGRISRAEWSAAGAAMFQRLDANNDGQVTREEARAARPQRPAPN